MRTLILSSAALLCACTSNPTGGRPNDSFDRAALLGNAAENVIYPAVLVADDRAHALAEATVAYCAALGTPAEAAARQGAQAAWKQMMSAWQILEVMKVGPLANKTSALRDQVYSWPVISTCAVDQEVVALRAAPDGFDIAAKLTNRRGLDAVEYLLFRTSLEQTCPPQSAPAAWAALDQSQRIRARCDYALRATADIVLRVDTLRSAWNPAEGNFVGKLSSAGSGSGFRNQQEAVNALSNALFYLDTETKDMKLAEPAGISINRCGAIGQICPEEAESQHANHAKENIAANLDGFRRLFLGNDANGREGVGFDDFLSELGATDLATQMLADLDAARSTAANIPGSFALALRDAPDAVILTHTRVKGVTDQMKSRFLTVLGLDLPDAAAGDND